MSADDCVFYEKVGRFHCKLLCQKELRSLHRKCRNVVHVPVVGYGILLNFCRLISLDRIVLVWVKWDTWMCSKCEEAFTWRKPLDLVRTNFESNVLEELKETWHASR